MTKSSWEIAESADDWECGWENSRRFLLRYSRALSLTDELKAVEEMAEVVEFFSERVRERRKRGQPG
jgi:hypothetical protein